MTLFEMIACLLVLAAFFSYVNYSILKLPPAIGLVALSLAGSLVLILVSFAAPQMEVKAREFVHRIDLNQTFLHGMLGFMLFAGSLHINLEELATRKWAILILSTVGVVISTTVVGLLAWGVLNAAGVPARLIYCLLFGALISPTDPIAVLAILRQAGVPKAMEIKIAGESLFNDGVGVVVFVGLFEIAVGTAEFDPWQLAGLFLWEAVGGAATGFGLGWIVYRMLRSVDNYQVEVLLSIALVAGGYSLVNALHMSGPIAMVVAGLLIGNVGRAYAMSPSTREHLDTFWELLDEILNAILFVLIGLEVLALAITGTYLLAGVAAVPIVLLARLVSVAAPVAVMRRRSRFARYTVRVLTWGGLRGGISVALALSLPREANGEPIGERGAIVMMTYVVVVFSVLVQGLTIGPLTRHWLRQPKGHKPSAGGHATGVGELNPRGSNAGSA
ncbi:MAG TPA: sodium:proton antiporter [Urbifossiella sp.]|nr:sodium:proton antiporter [Urbifossiella sp.]